MGVMQTLAGKKRQDPRVVVDQALGQFTETRAKLVEAVDALLDEESDLRDEAYALITQADQTAEARKRASTVASNIGKLLGDE